MGKYVVTWRPKKRAVQSELTERLAHLQDFEHKKIITLCGPDLDGAIGAYELHNLHKKGIILAEIDRTQIWRAILCSSKKNKGNNKFKLKDHKIAQLVHGDVFDIANKNKGKISGFDFDFCTTLNDEKIHNIYATVKDSKSNDVWVRITTCHRGVTKRDQAEMLSYIRTQFMEEFEELDYAVRGYRDATSPSMNVWQVALRRKKMEEQKVFRKMKDLKEKEKDMLRALVHYRKMYQWAIGYNDTDICRMFNINKGTLSALKAHSTMRVSKRS